jgi:hypothetical protein
MLLDQNQGSMTDTTVLTGLTLTLAPCKFYMVYLRPSWPGLPRNLVISYWLADRRNYAKEPHVKLVHF